MIYGQEQFGSSNIDNIEKEKDNNESFNNEVNEDQNDSNLNEDDEDEEHYDLIFPEKYHGKHNNKLKLVKQDIGKEGKITRIFENDKKEIIFPSGVRKETYPDGYNVVYFVNKDIKQVIHCVKYLKGFSRWQTGLLFWRI